MPGGRASRRSIRSTRRNFDKLQRGVDLPRRQLRSRAVHQLALDAQLHQRACSTRWPASAAPSWRWIPKTGEIVWTYREPNTKRWERSMRAGYGKGVAYSRDRRPRRHLHRPRPAFFLHALDAKTGQPLENWGRPVPIAGLPENRRRRPGRGSDLQDWGPWQKMEPRGQASTTPTWACRASSATSPARRRRSSSTASSIVGNSAEQGYNQTRIENVPGRHPRVRRPDREAPLEVPRHSAARRVRPRHVAERRVVVHGRRLVVGADVGRPRARHRLHSRRTRRRSTTSAASVRAPTCTARASSRST